LRIRHRLFVLFPHFSPSHFGPLFSGLFSNSLSDALFPCNHLVWFVCCGLHRILTSFFPRFCFFFNACFPPFLLLLLSQFYSSSVFSMSFACRPSNSFTGSNTPFFLISLFPAFPPPLFSACLLFTFPPNTPLALHPLDRPGAGFGRCSLPLSLNFCSFFLFSSSRFLSKSLPRSATSGIGIPTDVFSRRLTFLFVAQLFPFRFSLSSPASNFCPLAARRG